MAKEFEMTMKGGRELEEFMRLKLPVTVARNSMLAGMRVAAKPMVSFAKAKVAKKSHALSLSIGLVTVGHRALGKRKDIGGSFAAISLGPTSYGRRGLLAWSVYKSHYKQSVSLKRGAKIGRIRHGHLVEFGHKTRSGGRVPGRPFMEPAANAMGPIFVSLFVGETRKKVDAAIRRHNAKSQVKRR